MRLGVLVSGRGSNLAAILQAGLRVAVVISNRPGARALEIAAAHGVPSRVLRRSDFPDAETRDGAIGRALADAGVELAILAGCVRILGMYTVDGPIIGLSFDGPIPAGCQPEQLTRRYLRDLGDVSSHVFRDGHLYLALPADAGIMAFEARYAEPTGATPHAGHPTLEPA